MFPIFLFLCLFRLSFHLFSFKFISFFCWFFFSFLNIEIENSSFVLFEKKKENYNYSNNIAHDSICVLFFSFHSINYKLNQNRFSFMFLIQFNCLDVCSVVVVVGDLLLSSSNSIWFFLYFVIFHLLFCSIFTLLLFFFFVLLKWLNFWCADTKTKKKKK